MCNIKTYPHCYSKSTGGGLWIALQYSMLVMSGIALGEGVSRKHVCSALHKGLFEMTFIFLYFRSFHIVEQFQLFLALTHAWTHLMGNTKSTEGLTEVQGYLCGLSCEAQGKGWHKLVLS